MAFHIHILRCTDGSYYVGHTDNLEHRINQHQSGDLPGYTATRRPAALVWSETFGSRDEALSAGLQIKGGFEALKLLARKSFDTPLRQAQRLLRMNGGSEDLRSGERWKRSELRS